MRPFVDTNVLVYAHDRDEPEKQAVALRLLEHHAHELVISTQVLTEFYVATTRKLTSPLEPTTAAEQVDELARGTVVIVDVELVLDAVTLSQERQLSLWDALIIRAAQRGGCDTVLTEDLQDGAEFDDLVVRNPFGPS